MHITSKIAVLVVVPVKTTVTIVVKILLLFENNATPRRRLHKNISKGLIIGWVYKAIKMCRRAAVYKQKKIFRDASFN